MARTKAAIFAVTAVVVLGTTGNLWAQSKPLQPNKVVIVIDENHDVSQIVGNPNAPFINRMAAEGLNFTNAHGTDHASQPNYLELFSGANPGPQGLNSPLQTVYSAGSVNFNDPATLAKIIASDGTLTNTPLTTPNLGGSLYARFGLSGFTSYAEGLPFVGDTTDSGTGVGYVTRHSPVVNWQAANDSNIGPNQYPSTLNQPLTSFPTNFNNLPNVSFVIPNTRNDMHDSVSLAGLPATSPTSGVDINGNPVTTATTIANGDTWLQNNLGAYLTWAKANNSLLIFMNDENDFVHATNDIPLIIDGSTNLFVPGQSSQFVNHFNTLRTLEDIYGLSYAGLSGDPSVLPFATNSSGQFIASVPEPASLVLATFGFLGVGLLSLNRHRRARRAA